MRILPAPDGAVAALPHKFAEVVSAILAEARIAIASDPYEAGRCIDRLEAVFLQRLATGNSAHWPPVRSGGLAQWQALRISQHVEENLAARLSISELARVVSLSETHFARAFKTSFGVPPHTYVMDRRIRQAKALLLENNASLSQIALACGLADQAHLCRLFRRHVGDSPRHWRRGNVGVNE